MDHCSDNNGHKYDIQLINQLEYPLMSCQQNGYFDSWVEFMNSLHDIIPMTIEGMKQSENYYMILWTFNNT